MAGSGTLTSRKEITGASPSKWLRKRESSAVGETDNWA